MMTHTPVTSSNTTCVTNKVTRSPSSGELEPLRGIVCTRGFGETRRNETRHTGCRSRLTPRATTIFLHVGLDIFERQLLRMPTVAGSIEQDGFTNRNRADQGHTSEHSSVQMVPSRRVLQPYRYPGRDHTCPWKPTRSFFRSASKWMISHRGALSLRVPLGDLIAFFIAFRTLKTKANRKQLI